ncbi:MAG TPA: hypothetical protein VGN57_09410 [Pirellulaceae bacterium]|jgi:hypothetical protein|nr:hypothetical protein [Pirellulaceae bacterium]
MLADRELATIRAALAYWRDEMTPHGTEAQAPYFGQELIVPLTEAEIERLRERCDPRNVRYARSASADALQQLSREEADAVADTGETVLVVIGPFA